MSRRDDSEWYPRHRCPAPGEWEQEYRSVETTVSELESNVEGFSLDELQELLECFEAAKRSTQMLLTCSVLRDVNVGDCPSWTERLKPLYARIGRVENQLNARLANATYETVDDVDVSERYRPHLRHVFASREHVQSPAVEATLADLRGILDAPSEIYRSLVGPDFDPPTVEHSDDAVAVTKQGLYQLLTVRPRRVRREAYTGFVDAASSSVDALAATYDAKVRANVALARIRDYQSAQASEVSDLALGSERRSDPYESLLSAVSERQTPLSTYCNLKAEQAGIDDVEIWDLFAPTLNGESWELSPEQTEQLLVEAVEPLGPDYQSRLSDLLETEYLRTEIEGNRWATGLAYTFTAHELPPRILMNYEGGLFSAFVLVHELGHATYSSIASESRSAINGEPVRPVSEVPSHVHEVLFARRLLEVASEPAQRREVLDVLVRRLTRAIYWRGAWMRFVRTTHQRVEENVSLTPQRLDAAYRDAVGRVLSPLAVRESTARGWVAGQYDRPLFDNYRYVLGGTTALALFDRARGGEFPSETYLRRLESGAKELPGEFLDALDAPPDPNAISRAFETYETLVRKLDALLRS